MDVTPTRQWQMLDPGLIVLESIAGLAMLVTGGYSLFRYKKKLFPLWLAALISWFTVCKYAICRHCEHFGEPCEFYNLGLLAKALWKERSPVSELNRGEWMTEAVSASTLYFLPLAANWSRRSLRNRYLRMLAYAYLSQFLISCRTCAKTASDPWKELCPNYRLGRKLFVRG